MHDALWEDEISTEQVISQPTIGTALHQIVHAESTPPAFYLLAQAADRWLSGLTPDTRARALRALPLAASVGTAVLTFLLACELMPLWAAAVAGLLVGFSSLGGVYATQLRAYAQLAFACVAFVLLLQRAAARPSLPRLALLAGAVVLGSLTHYFFLLTLGAGALWLLVSRLQRTILLRIAIALGIGLVPLALWAPDWLHQFRNGVYQTAPPFTFAQFVTLFPRLFAPEAIVSRSGLAEHAAVALVLLPAAALLLLLRPNRLTVLSVLVAALCLGALVLLSGEPILADRNLTLSKTTLAEHAALTLAVLVAAALLLRERRGRLVALCLLVPFLSTSALVLVTSERIFKDRNLIGLIPFAAIVLAWACASLPWRRVSYAAGALVGSLVLASFAYGQFELGRTPYDHIARAMLRQGFRNDEPILWFGSWQAQFPVGWYLTLDEPADTWPRLVQAPPGDGRGACTWVEVVARSTTGRLWLHLHRRAIVAQTSLPSFGDVPQGGRGADLIVARVRWSPGILTAPEVVVGNLDRPAPPATWSLYHVAGTRSPCLRS
jgi:hypothetical protein